MSDPINRASSSLIDSDLSTDEISFGDVAASLDDIIIAPNPLPFIPEPKSVNERAFNGIVDPSLSPEVPNNIEILNLFVSQDSLDEIELSLSYIASDSERADNFGLDASAAFRQLQDPNFEGDTSITFNAAEYLSVRTDVLADLQNRGFEGTALNIKAAEHYIVFGRFEEAGVAIPDSPSQLQLDNLSEFFEGILISDLRALGII